MTTKGSIPGFSYSYDNSYICILTSYELQEASTCQPPTSSINMRHPHDAAGICEKKIKIFGLESHWGYQK